MACPTPRQLLDSRLLHAGPTESLPQCYRKRSAPNHDRWIRKLTSAQNCNERRVRSNPMPNGLLRQNYADIPPDQQPNLLRRLMRSYQLLLWLLTSPQPAPLAKSRFVREATRTWRQRPRRAPP